MRRTTMACFCVGAVAVLVTVQAAEANALIKAIARYCLRNVTSGFTCYVTGRGGELSVDAALTATWSKAFAKDAERKAETKPLGLQPPASQGKPAGSLFDRELTSKSLVTKPLIEPLGNSELTALSQRLNALGNSKSPAAAGISEGFVVYSQPPSQSLSKQMDSIRSMYAAAPEELACRQKREQASGLSLATILGSPNSASLMERRRLEVLEPCKSR